MLKKKNRLNEEECVTERGMKDEEETAALMVRRSV